MGKANTLVPLPPDQLKAVRLALTGVGGDIRALADKMSVAESSLTRCLAGLKVRRGTVALVTIALRDMGAPK